MQNLLNYFERFSLLLGKVLASLVVALATLCAGLVVLRYGFNIGSIAAQELLVYFHAAIFLLGFSVALQADQHVRVDIFYQRFTARSRDWINLCCIALLLLPFCVFLLLESWPMVKQSWLLKEGSADAGGLQAVFLLKSLIPVAAILLFLQGLAQALRACVRLSQG